MEDRKRPAAQSSDDLGPPTKRQAVNGTGKSQMDADMPWKDDLEAYQKDAILRQMQEYKRQKANLESQLKEIQKRSVDHDDHLRIIDAWFSQLLDEVRLLSQNVATSRSLDEGNFAFTLQFKNNVEFEQHLSSKAKEIKENVNAIFANIASNGIPKTDADDLRIRLSKLLAEQKEHMVEVDRLRTENEQLNDKLEIASLRCLKAEKRLDRAKSSAVAKLEAQAIASTGNSSGSGIGAVENGAGIKSDTNGNQEDSNEANGAAYKEASAVVAKQKEQLDAMMAENKTLTEQLTIASSKASSITDEDYSRTELFKHMKSQHEEVIKRVNHLEATNIQLREEAEKLQAERTAFRTQIEHEAHSLTGDLQSQLQQAQADLSRIRVARDELEADQRDRKAAQDFDRQATDQIKELVGSAEDRIVALESEVERLRAQVESQPSQATPRLEDENVGEVFQKYELLKQSFDSVNKELPAMEKAYKRSMALASKKVMDFAALEERVAMLIAEKNKADQKYFATRKDMDNRTNEIRALRAQNGKSSEIITQLKDGETSQRMLVTNLEKQLSDLRQANTLIMAEHKKSESSASSANMRANMLQSQVTELTNLLKTKDAAHLQAKQRHQATELELEQIRVRLEHVQGERDSWKAKSMNNQSGEEEMLRTLALCTICRNNFKNTVLKTCGHLFCNECVEARITNRMRKCPNCAKAFGRDDVMLAHM